MKESAKWIIDCTNSCSNSFQLKCCRNLLELFKTKYEDDPEVDLSIGEIWEVLDQKEVALSMTA